MERAANGERESVHEDEDDARTLARLVAPWLLTVVVHDERL